MGEYLAVKEENGPFETPFSVYFPACRGILEFSYVCNSVTPSFPLFVIMRKKLFISFLCFSAFLSGYSQQYFFSNYSIEQGLSQSVVNCLFQDSRGYIWIGTQNGLNKFNGYTFESFATNPTDSNSISNNWIYSIDEDRAGNLWIGTKGGLNRFIKSRKKFERINYKTGYIHNVTDYTYDAICSFNGTIIINTPPVLTIYYPETGKCKHYYSDLEYDGAVKDNIIPVIEDFEGLIWIGSTRGLSCFDRNTQKFRYYLKDENNSNSISDNNITALYEDRKGNIWIGTSNGLTRYNKVTNTFTRFFYQQGNSVSMNNNFIRAIVEDKSGNIWFGTEGGGLTKMTLYGKDQVLFDNLTSDHNGLSHNIVLALLIDKTDNLWIGALQGISKTDLKKRKFQLYRRDNSPYTVDLLGNVIASIFKDDDGLLWIGNWGQGLNIYNRKTGEIKHFSTTQVNHSYIPNDFVHVIFKDSDKRIWIGTRDGIFIYNREKSSFSRFRDVFPSENLPNFKGVRIYMIIQDHHGNYWIGTQNGLFKMNLASFTTEIFSVEATGDHKIGSNLVYCLLEDRDGFIWIATLNGLDVYHPMTKKITHYQKNNGSANGLCDNFVITLCEDHNGDIWIGTSSYVNKFVKKDSSFLYYSQENGLPSNRIFEILEDTRKNIWFATGNGLSRFDTATGKFRTYTVEEGLQSLEFNLRASYKSNDGEIFLGGMNGFNSFYSDSLNDNPFIPPIVITSLYKSKGSVREYIEVENRDQIILNYNDYNFTIEFAALEYTHPGNNRYAYKMEGISDDWIDIGNRHFVPFSNLSPGEYTLRVKGSNNDGKWNETGTSLSIIIRPPWWKSTLAYISYIIAIILFFILFIKQREKNLVRTRDLLEEKVKERTLRIEKQKTEIVSKNEELNDLNKELKKLNTTKDKFFSIIAHDLRNPFNTIFGLSDILLSDYKEFDDEKIRYYLTNIRDASNQAFDLLQNLLIWARSQTGGIEFSPVEFDLGSRVADNIELTSSQAGKKNILVTTIIEDGYTVFGDINMINTVLRNLLTNAIKFTPQGGKITIYAREAGSQHEISVKDTGVGIEKENISKIFRIENKYTTKGTEKERGTGLGLVLCKEFIEKHGGRIWVESEPGIGSEFKFTLSKC
jgi:ligand-binding sensor domain-containing protein/signal transduction histidine kinase